MIKGTNVSLVIEKNNPKKIIDTVSFEIPAGRITTFIGESGSGKTSLLRCIAALNHDYQGSITIQGTDIRTILPYQRAQKVGFVFQSYNLFPHMTVLENCIQPLCTVYKTVRAVAEKKARSMLEALGMGAYINAYPSRLSGGQQQRVALARALCSGSQTLLLDEPTSALDPENTKILSTILRELCKQGVALALSSQDLFFITAHTDRMYLMKQGTIIDAYDAYKQQHLSAHGLIQQFMKSATTIQ